MARNRFFRSDSESRAQTPRTTRRESKNTVGPERKEALLMLESFDGGLQHDVLGRGFARPELELTDGLLDEHLDAAHDGLALIGSAANQYGVHRVIDHVEHDLPWNVAV